MSLTQKTMIAYLKVEMLGMSSKNRHLTDEINSNHLKTTNEAGFYQKCKIDRASVSGIISTTENARRVHKKLTRPFGDDGWRLLPASRVKEYANEMRAAKADFEMAVHDAEARWASIIADQQARLASSTTVMFDPADYPYCSDDGAGGFTVEPNVDLSKFYTFDFELRPTPDEGHIVIELEKETIAELKDQFKADQQKNLENSKIELWQRLIKPVAKMAEICGEDKRVYKSLVENLKNELDILKDLNVNNDLDMTNIIKDIEAQLTGYTPGQIRDDKRLKSDLGHKAKTLTDVVASHLQGNSPPN